MFPLDALEFTAVDELFKVDEYVEADDADTTGGLDIEEEGTREDFGRLSDRVDGEKSARLEMPVDTTSELEE